MVRLLRTSPSISPHSTRLLSHFSFLLLISFFTKVVDSQSTLNLTSLLTTTVSPTLSASTSILTVPTTSHFSSLMSPSPNYTAAVVVRTREFYVFHRRYHYGRGVCWRDGVSFDRWVLSLQEPEASWGGAVDCGDGINFQDESRLLFSITIEEGRSELLFFFYRSHSPDTLLATSLLW